MADKLIMEVLVSIEGKDVSFLKGPAGEVVMIPFGGTVQGEIFNGVVCPGGVDCQRVNLTGVRHMCARYMLEGTDSAGERQQRLVQRDAVPLPDGADLYDGQQNSGPLSPPEQVPGRRPPPGGRGHHQVFRGG